jgi:biopolymer transport protein ExbD
MDESSMSSFANPSSVVSASIAPLFGVALSLSTLWIAAIPSPTHSVALTLEGCCYMKRLDEIQPHNVLINSNDEVVWDGELLRSRAALEDRMRRVGGLPLRFQPAVIVESEMRASYGSYVSVLAAAQRNGVQRIGLIGEFRREVIMTIPPTDWPID